MTTRLLAVCAVLILATAAGFALLLGAFIFLVLPRGREARRAFSKGNIDGCIS